jgi:hypothetical protein
VPPPTLWGDEATVRERLRDGIAELRTTPIRIPMRWPYSVPETVEFHRKYFGPLQGAFAALPGDAQAALRRDLEELFARHNRATDGTTDVEFEFLEVVARRA